MFQGGRLWVTSASARTPAGSGDPTPRRPGRRPGAGSSEHRRREPGGGAQWPHQIGMRLVGLVHQAVSGGMSVVRCNLRARRCGPGSWHIPCTEFEPCSRLRTRVVSRGRRSPCRAGGLPCRQSPPRREPKPRPPKPAAPKPAGRGRAAIKSEAALTLSSRNYSSWSLRGWLMARFAGLDVRGGDGRSGRRRRAPGDPAAVPVASGCRA